MLFPEIQTDRLFLRQIVKEDQKNIFEGLSHPEVIKFYGINYSTFDTTLEQMNWYRNLEKSGSGIWWTICSKNEIFMGAIGFNDLVEEHKKAEFGFWLLPQFWKQGYINEAAQEVLSYGFEKLKLHRIEAYVESENIASAITLKKLDFSHEGRMVDSEFKYGKFISVDIFAQISRENKNIHP